MNLKVLIQIAKTHLFSRAKQTIIAALGVTFGISMFIAMVGFMSGTNEFLDDLTLSNTAHIRLFKDLEVETESIVEKVDEYTHQINIVQNVKPTKNKNYIKNSIEILQFLKGHEKVKAISPRMNTQVFYTSGSLIINGSVVGIIPKDEDNLFDLSDKIVQGSLNGLLSNKNGLIVGRGLARSLNLELGDYISLTASTGGNFRLKVVGIFATGLSALDKTTAYVTISTAQKLAQKSSNYLSDINIDLHDIEDAKEFAQICSKRFDLTAEDFDTANAMIKIGANMRNIITYSVAIALLIVAGFGIYNILNMMIYEKMDDIAILKATGFSGNDIRFIFILEALLIGVSGGILGLLIGYLMSYGISQVPFETDEFITMDRFPVSFNPLYYIIGISFAIISTFLAGYFPARKASKIDPVEIIRGK